MHSTVEARSIDRDALIQTGPGPEWVPTLRARCMPLRRSNALRSPSRSSTPHPFSF